MLKETGKLLGILTSLATIAAACIALIALIPAFGQWLSPREPIQNHPSVVSNPDIATSVPMPTANMISPTDIPVSNDARDIAAQTLGYANVDQFMSAFGIPSEVKSRISVCRNEETWCLGVFEEPGQADFHFTNITNCILDGKQGNGTSTIPSGFDGMIKGFTVRPCSR